MPLSPGDVVLTNTGGVPQDSSSPQPVQIQGYTYNSFSPDPDNYPATSQNRIALDASNRLETHSTVLSDEGSFRDDFSGAALTSALTGTLTFTNGSFVVTGSGTSFTTQAQVGQWLKKSSDSETLFCQISSVGSDTSITLASAYGGTSASGVAGVVSNWMTLTPTGGSIAVSGSIVSIASGTTSGQLGHIQRNGDYLPYTSQFYVAISQRIANQTAYVGFADSMASPGAQCWVRFTGTVNTQVDFLLGSSAAETDSVTVTLPNGGVTSAYHTYKIDLSGARATLSIDDVIVAQRSLHLPGPYVPLNVHLGIVNTGTAASSTTISSDYIYFYNCDRVQLDNDFVGEATPTTNTSIATNGATAPTGVSQIGGTATGGYVPGTDPTVGPAAGTITPLTVDQAGSLNVRARVLTDEESYRDDFQGAALDLAVWSVAQFGTGTSYTVGSSLLNVVSGTASGAEINLRRAGDYGPFTCIIRASISQRIANQTCYIGFCNDPTVPAAKAIIIFDGTNNTQVRCHVQSSSTETEEDLVTLPFGWITSDMHDYSIEVGSDYVTMFCDGEPLASYYDHIPSPYTVMNLELEATNAAVVTSTTMAVDYVHFENHNVVQIGAHFQGSPIPIRVVEEYHTLYGLLTTTATTADQLIISYTVPTGRTLYIHSWSVASGNTAVAATPVKIGKNTLTEPGSGTTQVDGNLFAVGVLIAGTSQQQPWTGNFGSAPVRWAKAGDVVKVSVTPSAATSTTWRASLNIVLRR